MTVTAGVRAQYVPLDQIYTDRVIQYYQSQDRSFLSSMKPWLFHPDDSLSVLEKVLYPDVPDSRYHDRWLFRKIFNENLVRYKPGEFKLTVDPLFNLGAGREYNESKNTWINTRGVNMTGVLGNTISFNTEIYENQGIFPSFIDSITRAYAVMPGQGFVKSFRDGKGFDYFYSNGYLNYSPSKYVDLTLGYGKNFIGDGYRSMILSDASFNYPYLKVSANFGKIRYTVLYAQFMDRQTPDPTFGYARKWSTMHYLQALLWGRLNIGFFDAIVWEHNDTASYRGFDVQYLNPVILLRPVEESFRSPDNAMMGGTFNLRINRYFIFYGQLFLDEFKLSHMLKNDGWWANKYGYQLGLSGWNLFGIKALNARVEYNQARPYTYSYMRSVEGYSHFNQPLAHPMGANFREGIFMASYTTGNWMANIKMVVAMYGADTAGKDFGKNVFLSYEDHVSELDNKIGQGLKTNLSVIDASVSYLLNRRTNMRIELGITSRNEQNAWYDKKMFWIYAGIRTGLRNLYYDF
jgi:hypothetical protein